MPILGVNVDHVATVRQARMTTEPDPVWAACLCEAAGCDSIVAHLREDRRHIQDRDVDMLKKVLKVRFNLEMSINREIVDIACRIKPHQATLVPEKRRELTTEGGLDIKKNSAKIRAVIDRLKSKGVDVSLFIDPVRSQIEASKKTGAGIIELHTGNYADAGSETEAKRELKRLQDAVKIGADLGLVVNAGHGLNYRNVSALARIPGIYELNIGHSIISRAVIVGIFRAVQEMKELVK